MAGATQWLRALGRRLRRVLPFRLPPRRLGPRDAYRLWSETYDSEADNVVLVLEQEVFSRLLTDAPVADKVVVDIGCGTGRHWRQILSGRPRLLHGVDSSPEMLARFRTSFPDATLHLRSGSRIGEFGDGTVDLVVSTLMLGHVREVDRELREWIRLLRPGGEIIVTDFHPEAFRSGMRRTFTHRGATFEVEHHVHTVHVLEALFRSLNVEMVHLEERTIDHTVRADFERQNYREAYRKGLGTPLVLGLRLRKAA
jgi:ubiquinone/menaquinone biosynthesis C-methylase UbiE